ncbi:Rieske domain-containing protein [Porphyridium purpureum]|uniref:Rieske domain-containing protein n=1 Tax=Porphyridium purpureum TaxID=35688 RepID=A0A5J4YYP8_PORPP|nr:Rieske domain-containing protein [Porphyridium purpureum]|eukprot:POR4614..scf209_3
MGRGAGNKESGTQSGIRMSAAPSVIEVDENARVDEDGFVCVHDSITLPPRRGTRLHLKVNGRHVSVIRGRGGKLYCVDSVCYHAGGPLTAGNIEDVAGRECVVCPWHSYKLDLSTGEGLYTDLNYKIASKGKRQRTHDVQQRGDGRIYVRLNLTEPDSLPSDEYAYGKQFAPAATPINETSAK